MRRLTQTLIGLALLAFVPATARAAEVVDKQVGYSFTPPKGWRRVPDAALARMRATNFRPGGEAPNFVAAYEPGEHTTYFQYPYLVVQMQPYGKGVTLATVSRSELDAEIAQLTGTPASRFTRNLSGDAAKSVSGISFEVPMVFTNPPGFTFETTMKVAGVGAVHGRTISRLGRTNAVSIHFYAKDREWLTHWDTLDQLETSFRRTPDQAVTVSTSTRTTNGEDLSGAGLSWGSLRSTAIIGGIVGGLAGAFTLVAKGRKSLDEDEA
jgi:hypothetical protein